MSVFHKDLSTQILTGVGYAEAAHKLFEAYINKSIDEDYAIDEKTIRKLATAVQYFCYSESKEYLHEGSIILSMLLLVCGDKTKELVQIAKKIFYESGDFPNIELLDKKFEKDNFKLNIFEEMARDLRSRINTVEGVNHTLTDYQRILWEDLSSGEDIITVAPTSTGKTHIILRHLMRELVNNEEAFAAVVVPTRALISEIANNVYEISKSYDVDIEICTMPKDGKFKDKTFFVMTQERLFEVLQQGDIRFNYLFIDEAHNISDKSRGVLLHLTLQKLLEDSYPQIIISMPSRQYLNAFDPVFTGINFIKRVSSHTPVAKIVMNVSLKGKKINISRMDSGQSFSIDKKFNGDGLAEIVFRLGKNESNIIYRNRTDYCETMADSIAALIQNNINSQALEESADYVERYLHKDFSLAKNLRKGVAFHYGPLPGVVRTMIEDLARKDEIKYIVCTSTLAEGVNLPAKNLFLQNPYYKPPYKPAERLEAVKIDNITGRAGRMLEHFAGNIFLIDYSKWKYPDYFDEKKDDVNKIPTYFKVLNEGLDGVVEALNGIYSHDNDEQYTYYTIANKLIREFIRETLPNTLNSKELSISKKQKAFLSFQVEEAHNRLVVDPFTLEANPTIGFIQQNALYKYLLKENDLSAWVLPHPMSPELYARLFKICNLLREKGIFLPKDGGSIGHICVISKKWITGTPLRSIIAQQIDYDAKAGHTYNCNKSVRDVIKIINNDIRFKMSSSLRCYHSLIVDVIAARQLDLQSVKMYSFVEVGGCQERIIDLVNLGLSRETSIEINQSLPKNIDVKSISELRRVFDNNMLNALHVITIREISKLIS